MSADTSARLTTSLTVRPSAPRNAGAQSIMATAGGASSAPGRLSPEAGGITTDTRPAESGQKRGVDEQVRYQNQWKKS